MYAYVKDVDNHLMKSITEFEETQLVYIKEYLIDICPKLITSNCFYDASIVRWIDKKNRCKNKTFDGYTAMIQIDFYDEKKNLIIVDETICSIFDNILYIAFIPIARKYRIFKNEDLNDLKNEIVKTIDLIEHRTGGD
ncbi:MAG: hypothetical protein IJK26_04555 [Clostridia bacterium]|nr:hypothetical protein [Clostridia bacterium]